MSEQLGLYNRNVRDLLGYAVATDPASPDTFFRRNLPRLGLADSAGDTGNVALATGVMTSVPLFLVAGELVTNLSFISGATAAGTPTAWWFALYDTQATAALIAQSADQTTTAWAANTVKTLALATAYRVVKTGLHWAAINVTATTPPTLIGAVGARPVVTGEGNVSQSSGSGLTTTAPATIATPAIKNFVPLAVAT
jgi:hypothetical protein